MIPDIFVVVNISSDTLDGSASKVPMEQLNSMHPNADPISRHDFLTEYYFTTVGEGVLDFSKSNRFDRVGGLIKVLQWRSPVLHDR